MWFLCNKPEVHSEFLRKKAYARILCEQRFVYRNDAPIFELGALFWKTYDTK